MAKRRGLRALLISLAILSILPLAVPVEAKACAGRAYYVAERTYSFECEGDSEVSIEAEDAVWGTPAMRVCTPSTNVCQEVCGPITVSGDHVRVTFRLEDNSTGELCRSAIGSLVFRTG